LNPQQDRQPVDFHADTTLPDYGIPPAGNNANPPLYAGRKERRLTRRAFLVGGALLGAGGLGVGYAASRSWMLRNIGFLEQTPAKMTRPPVPAHHAAKAPSASTTTTPTLPARSETLLSFTQHQQPVLAVTWSPSNQYLASGANDGSLLIWNTQGQVQASSPQAAPVAALAASPDGQQIAAGAGNQLLFLAAASGTTLANLQLAPQAILSSVAWSPQQPARLVSGELNNRAIVWDAANNRVQTVFTQHTAPVEAVSWASDGQTVASSSQGGVVRVWNGGSGEELHGLYLDAQIPMRALAFAPGGGGQLAVGGDDGVLRLWNGLACQQQKLGVFGLQCVDMPLRLQGHMQAVRALGWSPDARLLASGGDDGQLIIWYPAQSAAPVLKVPHNAPVVALAWSPTGNEIATAAGNIVTIWRLSA